MNSHLPLAEPLSYDRLSPELLCLDPRQAMEVLKKFEENMSTIRDPHAWVSSAAKRLIEGGGVAAEVPPSAPSTGSSSAEERLMKRITWLNANVSLSSPLDYDQVAGSLLRLEIQQAMAVLKNLEENASTVLDPVAYVTSAVDNALMVGTVTLSSADTALDDALRKRVAWMNANVPLAKPLTYEQVAPSLLALADRTKAMEVLKGLEGSALEVEEPNEHVINLAAAYLSS